MAFCPCLLRNRLHKSTWTFIGRAFSVVCARDRVTRIFFDSLLCVTCHCVGYC